MNPTTELTELELNPLIQKLRIQKEGCFLFRRRRQPDWTDNYTLYRDKVQLNRLTQRQSVNIPLIKSTIKTLLKDIDDAPILYFSNIDNNDQAEVFYNSYWHKNAIENDLILKDIVDKRQVLLYGRSFKFMNIIDGNFSWEVVAPEDVLVDRYVDPTDIDSARTVIREHIYRPLASLATNPKYDTKALAELQKHLGTTAGLIKAQENQLDWVEKNRKMATMGVIDVYAPILGETVVELNEFFQQEFNPATGKDEVNYVVTAENMFIIYQSKLEDCIGETADHFWRNHIPCVTWGDETERTDFWSDGVADSLRTLNKVLNAWFSQIVENRTLRNFGMNYYNSSLTEEGFLPQTFEPTAWGWYPIPAGDKALGDQIMRVEVPDLEDTLEHMNFIMTIAQQASAATTFQQGVQTPGQQITLGEVQLLLANAEEKVKAMQVYYTASWEDFGLKYTKMLEAAGYLIEPTVIHKKGRLTKKNYAKRITPQDWYTKGGFTVEVQMKENQQRAVADSLQKLQYSKSLMPTNMTLDTIIKKKSLEFANLNPSEMAEVIKEDEMAMKAMAANPMAGMAPGGQPQATNAPMGQHMLPAPAAPMQQPQPIAHA